MPGITHWQHPVVLRVLPGQRVRAGGAGRPAVLGAGRAGDALGHLAGRDRGRDRRDGLAGQAARRCRSGSSAPASSRTPRPARCSAPWSPRCTGSPAARCVPTGSASRYAVYLSPESHSAGEKAVRIAGLGDAAIRVLDVDPSSLSVTADSLRAAVAADRAAGVTPLFVLATVGTTSTTAIDPVRALGEVCRARGSGCTSTPRTPGSPRSAPSSAGSTTASSSPTRTRPTRTSGCSPTSTATRSGSPTRTRWSARSRCCRSSSATRRPSPARSSTTGTGRSRSAAGSGR